MRRRNPYLYGPSVSGDHFIGRQTELQRLTDRILDSATPLPCSIVGEAHIGKSSLINIFEQIVKEEQRQDLLCLHYDMNSDFRNLFVGSEKKGLSGSFYRNFVTRISADLGDHPEFHHRAAQKASDPHLQPLMISNIQSFFRSIRQAGYWLILILDEFDAITEYFRFDSTGWKLLRALGSDQNYGLCYLFASRSTISTLEGSAGISSDLANIFETIRIELMSSSEARELVEEPIKRSGLQWSPQQSQLIQQAGGNHPYCLQMICSHLFRLRELGTLSPDLDEVQLIHQLRTQYAAFFEAQRRQLERSHLFQPLLRIAHGVPVQIEDRQIEELVQLGHLCPVEGERNRFRPFSLALDYYLRACGMQEKLWPIVEETETTLQLLVERQYRARFGENWLDEIRATKSDEHLGGATHLTMVVRWEIERDQESHNPFVVLDKRVNLIQYANALDLKQLISKQPELFQNIFSRQAHHLLDKALTRLHITRDPKQACYRRIRDEEASQTEKMCEELLHLIQPFLEQNTLLPLTEEKSETLPQIGETISKQYEIVSIIDERRYIVKAWDNRLTRDVVIKFLLNTTESRESLAAQRANLEREGRILAKLKHPNLVTVYDIITDPPGVVMDWIEGGPLSLTEYSYDDLQDMPLPLFAQVASQLCEVLNYTHSKGIIHRDIKPDNILLNEQNQLFLIDFGIARSLQHETVSQNKDGAYGYIGTAKYSAPEQFTTPGSVTPASDIFSLGVVLYQLLTHSLPFKYFSDPSNYKDGLLPPFEQESIPEPLFAILCEMLRQQPEQRPTARDLHKRFAQYMTTLSE